MLKYIGPLIVVADMSVSRNFYEQLLGQKVQMDFGENVSFEGNLAIHSKPHFQALLGGAAQYPVTNKANNGELYFETDEIEQVCRRLEEAGVEFIHTIREQPWGQRVLRLYDPGGFIVEVGETMDIVTWRLHREGLSIEQVVGKTGMPREFVEGVLRENAAPEI